MATFSTLQQAVIARIVEAGAGFESVRTRKVREMSVEHNKSQKCRINSIKVSKIRLLLFINK